MNRRIFELGSLLVLLSGFAFTQTPVGSASFNHVINWSQTGDLYFTVTGAPHSVCGDLVTTRNGSLLVSPGWICTDANGNVTTNTGPWTWANTPGDQTDTNIHFDWHNGTATYFTTNHVWDKSCPFTVITNATAATSSTSAFTGTAPDESVDQWGAGFDRSWTSVSVYFFDQTTGLYWNGSSYSGFSSVSWPATISTNLPNQGLFWSVSPSSIPPASAHNPAHSYIWSAVMTDGDVNCFPADSKPPTIQ